MFMTLRYGPARAVSSAQKQMSLAPISNVTGAQCPPTKRPLIAYQPVYFNAEDIDEKVVLSLLPTPLTTVIIATAMPAAIKPPTRLSGMLVVSEAWPDSRREP